MTVVHRNIELDLRAIGGLFFNYELGIMNYELRIMNYELGIRSFCFARGIKYQEVFLSRNPGRVLKRGIRICLSAGMLGGFFLRVVFLLCFSFL